MQKVGIVIPCFNEALRFDADAFMAFVPAHSQFHFCLVDDGSKDGTASLLQSLAMRLPQQVSVVLLTENAGKAEAIRQGIRLLLERGDLDYTGFIDADFSAPLHQLNHLIDFCQGHLHHDFILGSRVKRLGADIQRNPYRHYLGRVFATAVSVLSGFAIYDSQCGLKLCSVPMAKQLFGQPFLTRWLFDLELLYRLRLAKGREAGLASALEVPLTEWKEKKGSKLSLLQMLRAPFDLWRIHQFYRKSR